MAARVSLKPPPPSYYVLRNEYNKLQLVQEHVFDYQRMVIRFTNVSFGISSKGNNITCVFIRCATANRYTILYSHGNGADVGDELYTLYEMGKSVNCNVFTYDYSGYGRSSGKPSESNLYSDIECALNVLKCEYQVHPGSVILFGRSIGSVPTVDLATKKSVAGVVLVCPLASALRTLFPQMTKSLFFDVYQNIDKISKVNSPVLVIHGTEDEVISISQGMALHSKCSNAVDPLWIEGAGHNDIELSHFRNRLRKFIFHEVPNINKNTTQ